MHIQIPDSVRSYIFRVFSDVNEKISRKISTVPNIPEESLDITFIDTLSDYSAPKIVDGDWAVRMAAHFIGNIRHRRRFEIADLGIIVVFKKGPRILTRKLVLLQSKRLYPNNSEVIEFDDYDYDLGLALLTEREQLETPVFSRVKFEFDLTSSYGALKTNARQCTVIQEHLEDTKIPVHYSMYNPLVLPWTISYPVSTGNAELPKRVLGTRIVSAERVLGISAQRTGGVPLTVGDFLENNGDGYTFGVSLENFFDDVIRCEKGYTFDGSRDVGLHRLFSRKSGPIFCIVEIVIEENAQ